MKTHKKPTKEVNLGADTVFRGVIRALTSLQAKLRNAGNTKGEEALIDGKIAIREYRKRATKTAGGIGRK